MTKNLLALTLAVAACAGVAHADSITFDLTHDLSSGTNLGTPSGLGTGVFATVVFTQDGANVDVTETLATGYEYVNTGAGDSLMFNLTGNPTLTVTNVTAGFTFSASSDKVGNSVFVFDTTCTSCGSGGSNPLPGPLSFTIDNVTLAQLQFAPATGTVAGYYFISDVISPGQNGKTGDIGGNTAGVPSVPTGSTPEPSSLALLGTGVFGVAGFLRRKINN